jgi:hypothetical protein
VSPFEEEYDQGEPAPTPQPISLRTSVGEAGDFPVDALSPTIRDAIRAIIDIVQVPPAMAAQSVLAAAALVCQARYNVMLPTRRAVPTSLFLFSVAQSGDRKTTGDSHALKPIADRERELKDEAAHLDAKYQNELAAYEAARSEAKRAKGGRSEKVEKLKAAGSAPVPPPAGVLITDEATVPGLQKLFAEAMPSLGLFSDDGASWLGGYSMQDENSSATGASLSHLWDGKPVKRVRATGFELHYGRRLSLHLMVQPGVALKLFGNKALRDQGMMSRMLVAFPRSLRGQRFWRDPTEESWKHLEEYHARLSRRLRGDMRFVDEKTRELQFNTLELSPEARKIWIEFADHCERLMAPGAEYEDIGDFASKMPENAARIAAILSYFERSTEALEAEGITENAMRAGIHVVRFYAGEAVRLFGAGSVDDDSDNAQLLIDWIRKKGLDRVGLQYLSQSGPKQTRPGAVLKRTIALLSEHGHLRPINGGARISHGGKEKFFREAYLVIAEGD